MEDQKPKTKSTRAKTTKGKTQAKPKKVKLTFRPLYSATTEYSIRLKHDVTKVVNGQEILVEEPMIKGLDGIFTVNKNEVIEVTSAQCKALQDLGYIESEEQRKRRQEIEKHITDQHPERLSWEVMSENINNTAPMRDIDKIYADKLIILE